MRNQIWNKEGSESYGDIFTCLSDILKLTQYIFCEMWMISL